MDIDDAIVSKATEHYLKSKDFNGLPVRELFSDEASREVVRSALRRLVESQKISLEFGTRHPNPHIKAFSAPSAKDQITELTNSNLEHACVYPTPEILAAAVNTQEVQDRPFTLRLMLGEGALDFHAFDVSVLETYRNDPRYHYETNDISGWISVHDVYYESAEMKERDKVLLETFGFGYDEKMNRAVMVFTRYLHCLSAEHQQIWNAKLLEGSYKLHPDYFRTSILGEWGQGISIFEAFRSELKHVNAMATLIGKPPLFRNEFAQRPKGFGFLVRPTTKELNDFVLLLDQMMSDNLNKDFFRNDIELENETVRKDGKVVVNPKGTIQLLGEWFEQKMRFQDPKPFQDMIATFKNVRKLRQSPAHRTEDAVFDQEIFKKQRELVVQAYEAIRTIRLLLANHPAAKDYKIPEELCTGKIWTY
jgi:hypothetical protein